MTTTSQSVAPGRVAPIGELFGVVAIFAFFTCLSAYTQQITLIRFWDSDHYYWTTYYFATHHPVTAAAPYVYRIGLPWLVSFANPYRFGEVYREVNVIAAGLSAVLLVVWLRGYVRSWITRTLLAALFLAEWHGPARFVHYYPMYVDPPMFAFLVAGLMAIDWMRHDNSLLPVLALAALAFFGTLVREVMIVIPLALLFSRDRLGRTPVQRLRDGDRQVSRVLIPLLAAVAAVVMTRLVTTPRADTYTFLGAVLENVSKKPVFTWVLAWFFTFGPVLAIVAFDWRRAVRFLAGRHDLAVYLGFFALLSYIGGTDTERLLLWAMPAVYVLIGRAIERQPRLFLTAPLVILACAQAVSARVFWPVPSPGTDVDALTTTGPRLSILWALVNRAVVVDDFHWNLWSAFGSRPIHALTLAWDVTFVCVMVFWLKRRSKTMIALHDLR